MKLSNLSPRISKGSRRGNTIRASKWASKCALILCIICGSAYSAPSEILPGPKSGDNNAINSIAFDQPAAPATMNNVTQLQSDSAKTSETPAIATATLASGDAKPANEPEEIPAQPLAIQIESLKKQLIKLNRDLFILEEELLFPASTQVAVLLAIDADETFSLDSIKLKIDNKVVTQYLYTQRQIKALQRGGVQRLYMGNLRSGRHEITAVFIGYGPNKREYKRAATLTFDKKTGQKTIELKISASKDSYQPEFSVIES